MTYFWNVAGAFLEHIKDAGFDRVASGHYARVRKIFNSDKGKEERTVLLLCLDEVFQSLDLTLSYLLNT
jgi:tRNA U34 2-thiouridine synthase MnmA/TrmU